jgi:hypothetical protein
MEYKKSINKVITGMFALVLLSSLASAAGVTAFYWTGENERPLYLQPGETKDIIFELQNMVGSDEISFKVQIIKGSEFIKLLDSNEVYEVPAQTQNIPVKVRVTMPSSAVPGDRHNIGLSFTAVNPNARGFSLGSAFDKYFDIVVPTEKAPIVEENTDSNSKTYIYLILAIIILSIIIWFVRRNKK